MKSMTGFSSGKGAAHGASWVWDLRAVNARGMDIRLRLPDWIGGLEQGLRTVIQKSVGRGNVNLTLKLTRDNAGQGGEIDADALAVLLAQLKLIEESAIAQHGLKMAPTTAAELLQMPALRDANGPELDQKALYAALISDVQGVLVSFNDMRATEGRALGQVIADQLDQIEHLTQTAKIHAQARGDQVAATLRENLARVMDNTEGADPQRVAQELAMLAVKADVMEEIDRLNAHVAAAREMLSLDGPMGRKLDFLTQEFNREANTLCSKAQSNELTKTGLELKAVIEQMREQVQNVE